MNKLIMLLGVMFLFVGCNDYKHTINFKKNEILIMNEDYVDSWGDTVNKNDKVLFSNYARNYIISVRPFGGGKSIFVPERSVTKTSSNAKSVVILKTPEVTLFKLQLKCTKDGKTTESIVDEINFKSTEFVNCTVRQARIKYEPVIEVVEE